MPCSGIDRPGAPFAHSFFHGFCAMENNPSEASDEQNLPKRNFPRPRMSRNCQKQTFRALGKSKSLNFCVSNPLEKQNHSISAFPTPWKSKNAPFSPFGHGRRVENLKNKLSAMAERRKTGKATFRPRPTSRKPEKQAFGHSRKMKIRKNSLPPHFQSLSASLFLKKIQKNLYNKV